MHKVDVAQVQSGGGARRGAQCRLMCRWARDNTNCWGMMVLVVRMMTQESTVVVIGSVVVTGKVLRRDDDQ